MLLSQEAELLVRYNTIPITTTDSPSPLQQTTCLVFSSTVPTSLRLKPSVAPSQIHNHVWYATNSLAMLHWEYHEAATNTVEQEVQDMTDTSPSSPTRVVSTKSVCSIGRLRLGTSANSRTRVCIQSHHRCQHHLRRCERQGLCRSHLTEESPSP